MIFLLAVRLPLISWLAGRAETKKIRYRLTATESVKKGGRIDIRLCDISGLNRLTYTVALEVDDGQREKEKWKADLSAGTEKVFHLGAEHCGMIRFSVKNVYATDALAVSYFRGGAEMEKLTELRVSQTERMAQTERLQKKRAVADTLVHTIFSIACVFCLVYGGLNTIISAHSHEVNSVLVLLFCLLFSVGSVLMNIRKQSGIVVLNIGIVGVLAAIIAQNILWSSVQAFVARTFFCYGWIDRHKAIELLKKRRKSYTVFYSPCADLCDAGSRLPNAGRLAAGCGFCVAGAVCSGNRMFSTGVQYMVGAFAVLPVPRNLLRKMLRKKTAKPAFRYTLSC